VPPHCRLPEVNQKKEGFYGDGTYGDRSSGRLSQMEETLRVA